MDRFAPLLDLLDHVPDLVRAWAAATLEPVACVLALGVLVVLLAWGRAGDGE